MEQFRAMITPKPCARSFSARVAVRVGHCLPPWQALLPPLGAFIIQWLCWEWLKPLVWFSFYPAVFLSSWIGGWRGGVWATLLTTLAAWYFFLPPEDSFAILSPAAMLSIVLFVVMGLLISGFHERLHTARRAVSQTLATIEATKAQLDARVIEHQQADDSRREMEERLRIVTENAHLGFIIVSRELRYVYCNQFYADILGLPVTAIIGQLVADVTGSAYEKRARPGLDRAFNGERVTLEMNHAHPDGATRSYSVTYEPVKEEGAVTLVIAVVTDVTEKKQADEERDKMARIIEHSHDFIATTGMDGRVTFMNSGGRQMVGLSEERDLATVHIHEYMPLEWQDFVRDTIFPTAMEQGLWEGEMQLRNMRTGALVDVARSVFPLRDSTGEIQGLATVTRDITERKRAGTALKASEAQFHAADRRLAEIVQGMTEACFALDKEWRFTFVNDRVAALLSHSRDKMLGRTIWNLFGHLAGTPVEGHYRRAMMERVPVSFEAFSPTAKRWLDVRLFPTSDGIAAFLLDIDARKQAEETLRIRQEHAQSLLRLTRKLEKAATLAEILAASQEEVEATLGFHTLWFYQLTEDHKNLQLVMADTRTDQVTATEVGVFLRIEGDAMLEEIAAATEIVLVEDARTDPRTNKEIVAKMGNRTIINVPVAMADRKLGTIGTGTFGDEGVRALAPAEQRFFAALASHVAVVMDRVLALEKREQAQAALRTSEIRYRTTLDNMMEGCQIIGHDWRYLYLNAVAVRQNRIAYEDMMGRTMMECHPGIEAAPVFAALKRCMDERQPEQLEVVYEYPDGSSAIYQVYVQPVPEGIFVLSLDITARKQAEETLRASEAVQRQAAETQTAILNALPAHIALVDPDSVIMAVNESWRRFVMENSLETLGFYVGENYLQVCDAAAGEYSQEAREVAQGLRDVLDSTKSQYSIEYPCHSPTVERWFRLMISPLLPGQRAGAVVMHVDITERKKAEATVNESEERFRQLAESIHEVFWVTSTKKNKMLYISPAYQRIWGRSCESLYLSPHTWLDAIHPDDRAKVMEASQAKQTQGTYDEEYRIIRPDGTIRWINDRAFPVRDALGNVYRMAGVAQDISDRKLAGDRLAEQASLLDKARDAILVRNLEHGITYWNKSAERLYGWTQEEAVGRQASDLLYLDATSYQAATDAVIKNGEWQGELQQVTKSGSTVLVEARWTLVRDDQGQPRSILAINTDITEKKKMEQQFLRAQRMESIGTLAGGIAHDLNNVLAPIMLSIDLLKLTSTDKRALTVLSTIEGSARRGADMVQQILSFARGVEGQRVAIDSRQVIREIQHLVQDTFPKNICFKADLPEELPTFRGDQTQLHQVLLNLCVNARDAMPMGGELTVSARGIHVDDHYAAMNPGAAPGPYVLIKVLDSGAGMPREMIDKIFDPFFTTKEQGKGTGLGLSTVLAIVKSHGGFLNLYSEPNKGTTFSIYLPANADHDGRGEAAEKGKCPRGNDELILIVDDEAAVRTIAQQTLETYGYRVLVAADGAEAISLYSRHRDEIDVVLTDMMMPVMDGPAAIQVFKQLNPNVKIIAASGLASEGGAARATAMGVKHVLLKPYTAQAVLTMLHEVLREQCRP